MQGIDVSAWNEVSVLGGFRQADRFALIKASEGISYKSEKLDSQFSYYIGSSDPNAINDYNVGFYHYARPELGNTAQSEAKWFLQHVGHLKGKAVFALDWEGDALKCSPTWAKKWLDYVSRETGTKPLIYLNLSSVQSGKFNDIASAGFPLWLAYWSAMEPVINQGWKEYTIWQYTSEPYDKNVFNGTRKDWQALMGQTYAYTAEEALKEITEVCKKYASRG